MSHYRRLASKSSRKDFLTNLVDKVETGEVEKEELTAHVSTLMYGAPCFSLDLVIVA